MLENAYSLLYIAVLIALAVGAAVALIRCITGKTIINRFIGINILTTLVAIMICILTLFLGESYLPDVAIVYVMLSCIAVMLLNKIYINLFGNEKEDREDDRNA